MSLIDRLEEAVGVMQAGKTWPTFDGKELDRKLYLSSSEALRCLRHSWADKNDVPRDEDYVENWGYMNRGHGVEAWIIATLHTIQQITEHQHGRVALFRLFQMPEKQLTIAFRRIQMHVGT